MHMFVLYLLFLPPLLLLDYETDTDAAPIDYGVDDPSFSAKLPGEPPLITRYRLFLLSIACIRVV